MSAEVTDVLIVGAGPVGLLCAYLGQLCGLRTVVVDRSAGPLEVGRADALNARTLQLLEIVDLFQELHPLGKKCNTSSVWSEGRFISRQSTWWDSLEGCLHRHFLMLGQSHLEKLLDRRLAQAQAAVRRSTSVEDIVIRDDECHATLSTGETIRSKYVIGADGARSFVRKHFEIPFEIERPEITWVVIDGIIETDFPKVPEIIVFQTDTSDLAWIPREGELDRFYIRMDAQELTLEECVAKINRAIRPHRLSFKQVTWRSSFSVKEAVAARFFVQGRVFLAGDACHIHSVNGGQGLNTGLADAFNLMWKLNGVVNDGFPPELLASYETERKAVAKTVIESSGELVRSTKYSPTGTHALDYVAIVEKRAGNITGMGIRYGDEGPRGARLLDCELQDGTSVTRLYSLLDYRRFTLLIFGDREVEPRLPGHVQVIRIASRKGLARFWTESCPYPNQAVLVRPDSHIEALTSADEMETLFETECIA